MMEMRPCGGSCAYCDGNCSGHQLTTNGFATSRPTTVRQTIDEGKHFSCYDYYGFHYVVDNFKSDVFEVDTAFVTDRAKPYETAVKHSMFNNGKWIVLEWADTKEEAQAIHNKWVDYFQHGNVQEITDSYTGETFKLKGAGEAR